MENKEKTWWKEPFFLFSFALVLLIMGLIFYFSSQTGAQSACSSGRMDSVLIRWLYPDYAALSPERQYELYVRMDFLVRKTAHLLEFAALGFALRLHLQAIGRWRGIRSPQLLSWGIGTLYAVTDELHQLFSAGRAPRLADVGIDSLGVILGVLFFLLCAALIRRRQTKHKLAIKIRKQ